MLIFLPPSEGKRVGGDGPPVDLATLSFPTLTDQRSRIGTVLQTLCERHPRAARQRLDLSESLDPDRMANAELWTSPILPAGRRYTGVLYDALDYASLPPVARRRADSHVLTFSGLWGVTTPADLIPAYRLGICSRLPRIDQLPATWRRPLHDALDDLVATDGAIDLRSSGYSDMYRPSTAAGLNLIRVRITGPDGRRAASSYANKVAKGSLVREVLRAGRPSVDRLLAAATSLGLDASVEATTATVRLPPGWGTLAFSP